MQSCHPSPLKGKPFSQLFAHPIPVSSPPSPKTQEKKKKRKHMNHVDDPDEFWSKTRLLCKPPCSFRVKTAEGTNETSSKRGAFFCWQMNITVYSWVQEKKSLAWCECACLSHSESLKISSCFRSNLSVSTINNSPQCVCVCVSTECIWDTFQRMQKVHQPSQLKPPDAKRACLHVYVCLCEEEWPGWSPSSAWPPVWH